MNSGYKTRADLIAWRRNKVIELKAQGRSQEEIAQILQVSPATVTVDLQYLSQEAKQNIIEFTTKRLPLQIRIAIAAGESAARELWKISQEAKDNEKKYKLLSAFLTLTLTYFDSARKWACCNNCFQ